MCAALVGIVLLAIGSVAGWEFDDDSQVAVVDSKYRHAPLVQPSPGALGNRVEGVAPPSPSWMNPKAISNADADVFTSTGQQSLRKRFGEMVSTAELAPHQLTVEDVRCTASACNISLRAPAGFGAQRNNEAVADLLALASKSADALGGTFGVSSIDHRSEGSEVQLALMRNDAGQTVALSPDQVAKIRMETLQQYFKETKDGKELRPK